MLGDGGRRIRTAGMAALKKFRQTEIQHLGRTVAGNHQVLRLQIAVNDATFVRFGETVGNLRRDRDRFAKRDRACSQEPTHRLAINQLHRDVVRTVHVTEFIDRHDVWVIQGTRGTGFPLKAGQSFRFRAPVQRNGLDCDLPVEASIFRAIDLAHATRAQTLKNFVIPKSRARRQGGWC